MASFFGNSNVSRPSSYCGYLNKMSRTNSNSFILPAFQKRWFSIEGSDLRYYRSEHEAGEGKKIIIAVSSHNASIF